MRDITENAKVKIFQYIPALHAFFLNYSISVCLCLKERRDIRVLK